MLRMQPDGFDLLLARPDDAGRQRLRRAPAAGAQSVDRASSRCSCSPTIRRPATDEERRLLEQELVLEVIAKSAVHENPQMLAHVLDWHMQVASESRSQDETGESAGEEAGGMRHIVIVEDDPVNALLFRKRAGEARRLPRDRDRGSRGAARDCARPATWSWSCIDVSLANSRYQGRAGERRRPLPPAQGGRSDVLECRCCSPPPTRCAATRSA